MRRGVNVAAALAAALALAGCMEVQQTSGSTKVGKYQGKPDTPAWDNTPLAMGPSWTKGNRESWEKEIKNRQYNGQDEYRRIDR